MAKVSDLLSGKGPQVHAIGPDEPVLAAIQMMADKSVGALLVLREGALAGIVSERDYARKVILRGKSSIDTKVSDIMSGRVAYVTLDRTVEECLAIMTEKHFRHLPVLSDSHNVVGIISIGDLIKEVISQQQFIIKQLESYISS